MTRRDRLEWITIIGLWASMLVIGLCQAMWGKN
jgi:hypothetical protein